MHNFYFIYLFVFILLFIQRTFYRYGNTDKCDPLPPSLSNPKPPQSTLMLPKILLVNQKQLKVPTAPHVRNMPKQIRAM